MHMTKKAYMSAPADELSPSRGPRTPWLCFGLMVLVSAAFSFSLPGPVKQGLVTQITLRLADDWHQAISHTAGVLPRARFGD
jgi:hypothetical protein